MGLWFCTCCTDFVFVLSLFSALFTEIESKLDNLNQLKVKGLILGPIHTVQENQQATLNFKTIDPVVGTDTDLTSLLERAHKKGKGL